MEEADSGDMHVDEEDSFQLQPFQQRTPSPGSLAASCVVRVKLPGVEEVLRAGGVGGVMGGLKMPVPRRASLSKVWMMEGSEARARVLTVSDYAT